MAVPRQSCCLFWSVHNLYNNLKLQSYKGQPSKRACESMPSRSRALADVGLVSEAHMIGATKVVAVDEVAQEVNIEDHHCLPSFSMSSAALILFLVKMGFASPTQGGLRTGHGQRLSRECLTELLAAAFKQPGGKLHMRVTEEWSPAWPMSEPLQPDFLLPVRTDLCVQLQQWKAAVDGGSALAMAWWNHAVVGSDRWCRWWRSNSWFCPFAISQHGTQAVQVIV